MNPKEKAEEIFNKMINEVCKIEFNDSKYFVKVLSDKFNEIRIETAKQIFNDLYNQLNYQNLGNKLDELKKKWVKNEVK